MSEKKMLSPAFVEAFDSARIRRFNPIFKLDPGNVDAFINWATSEMSSGRAQNVVDELQGKDIDADDVRLHFLGNAQKFTGKLTEALTTLERARSLRAERLNCDPSEKNAVALASTICVMGEVAVANGNMPLSEELFLQARQIAPTFWVAHVCLLCNANQMRNAQLAHQRLDELEAACPTWRQNEQARTCITEDATLHWVRAQPDLAGRLFPN
jgi:hypothetical protein